MRFEKRNGLLKCPESSCVVELFGIDEFGHSKYYCSKCKQIFLNKIFYLKNLIQ
jgi:hypothetical protein